VNQLILIRRQAEEALRLSLNNQDVQNAIVLTFETLKTTIEQPLSVALGSNDCSIVVSLLHLVPDSASVSSGGSFQFNAVGDLPPYTFPPYSFSIIVNRSGGSIDQTTGLYTAGPTAGVTDMVRVTDAAGNFAHSNVAVLAGIQISPTSATVARGLRQNFSATGGVAPYVFSMLENNSGGSVDAITGGYTAGFISGLTDIVRTTDANGSFFDAPIDVEPGGVCSEIIVAFMNQLAFLEQQMEEALRLTSDPAEREAIVSSFGNQKAGLERELNIVLSARDCSLTIQLLRLTPPDVSVLAGVSFQFSVGGDLPPYTSPPYSFGVIVNRSGGAINQSTGLYTAGPVEGVRDVIRVVDTNGHTSHATVEVLLPNG
jgi:hypothetical protein